MPAAEWLPWLISGLGSVGGAIVGSRAASAATRAQVAGGEKAAELTRQSSQEALDFQKEMFNRNVLMRYPWLQMGTQALNPFGKGMGLQAPEGGYAAPSLKSLTLPTRTSTLAASAVPGGNGAALPAIGTPGAPTPGMGTLPSMGLGAVKGALTGVGAGAAAGALIGIPLGPVGMLAGATIGGLRSLIGRGRKQADKIVPYQNELTAYMGQLANWVKAKQDSGVITPQDYQSAAQAAIAVRDKHIEFTKPFGDAGARSATAARGFDPMIQDWTNKVGGEGRMHGGPTMGGNKYVVGEKGPEILEMEPGSEGYVYPNPTLRNMVLKHRAAGGPVFSTANGIREQTNPDFDVNGNPIPGRGQFAQWSPNDPGLTHPGIGPGATADNPFGAGTPSREQVSSMPGGAAGVWGDQYALLDKLNAQSPGGQVGTPLKTPSQPVAAGQFDPMASWFPNPNSKAAPISQPGFAGNAPITLRQVAGQQGNGGAAQPYTGTSIPENPANPYAGMKAPYEPTSGEFLQPWQKDFNAQVGDRPFSFNASDVYKDPSYQFRLEEGQKALERSQAAKGMLQSGPTLKALTRYAQDFASQEYGNAYNRAMGENELGYGRDVNAYNRSLAEYRQRYNIFKQNQGDRYNRLAALSGEGQVTAGQLGAGGQTAATNLGNVAMTSGANQANIQQKIAEAVAQGNIAQADALVRTFGLANNYLQYKQMQELFKQNTDSGGAPTLTPEQLTQLGLGGNP